MDSNDGDLTNLTWLLSSNVMPNVAGANLPQHQIVASKSLPTSIANSEKKIKASNSNNPGLKSSKACRKPTPAVSSLHHANKKKLLVKTLALGKYQFCKSICTLQVHQKTNAHKLAEYHNQMLKEIDYKDDETAKPPYSYAALICLAMKDTKKKMTLSQIYKWIRDSFAYYRKADKSWQVYKSP